MRSKRRIKALGYTPVAAGQVGVGMLLSGHPTLGFGVIAAVMSAIAALVLPVALLLPAFPGSFGYWRVGPTSVNLSIADAALAVAFVGALAHVPWNAPGVRKMFGIAAVYATLLSVSVAFNPSQRAAVEVLHRLFLVICAVCVGAAVTNAGRITTSLRLFVAASVTVAGGAIVDALRHWPSGSNLPRPAYPWGIHKNAAGFLIACALILIVIAQDEVRLARPLRAPVIMLLFTGVVACQSRASGVTLILVLLLWSLTRDRRRISALTVVGAVFVALMTVVSVNALFTADNKDSRFNSLNTRITTYDASIDQWRSSKVTGVGLKYWRDPALSGSLGFGEPHNLVVSALAESGIIGLAALAYLVTATCRTLQSRRNALAAVALLVVVAKAVDSMLGIFWVAGTLTLPLLIVGIALGERAARAEPGPVRDRQTIGAGV